MFSINIKMVIFPLVLVCSVIAIWFVIKPLYDEARVLDQVKVPQLESLIQQENNLRQRTEKLFTEETEENNGDQITTVFNALPKDKNVKELIAQLESIVKKEKMILTSISIKDNSSSDQFAEGLFGQTGNAYQEIDGNIEVQGSYGQFKQLLKDMRILNRVININEINIINTSSGEGEATGRYTINLAAYWQLSIIADQVQSGLENKEYASNSSSNMSGAPNLSFTPRP